MERPGHESTSQDLNKRDKYIRNTQKFNSRKKLFDILTQ